MLGKEARTPVLPLSGSSDTYTELNDASEMNITCILAVTDTWQAMEGNEVCNALCHCGLVFVTETFKLKETQPWHLSDLKITARSVWFGNVTHLALTSPQPCLLISPLSSPLPFSVISDLFPPNLGLALTASAFQRALLLWAGVSFLLSFSANSYSAFLSRGPPPCVCTPELACHKPLSPGVSSPGTASSLFPVPSAVKGRAKCLLLK